MRRFSTVFALSGLLFTILFVSLKNVAAQADPEPTPVPPRIHVIADGESLNYIATFYAIPVEALQEVNNITDPALIFIGQELIIPNPEDLVEPVKTHVIADGETLVYIAELYDVTIEALQEENGITDPTSITIGQALIIPDTAVIPTQPPQERPQFHTIAAGESLAYIAGLYGTTVEALQLVNNITDPTVIFVGQELAIPSISGDEVPTTYLVQYGDTLETIALNFSTTVTAVAHANQIIAPSTIYAGQDLVFLSRTGTGAPQDIDGTAYLVKSGDTLWQVAARYNILVQELAELNNLDIGAQIYEGQRLRLPADDLQFTELPSGWVDISLSPARILPGDTAVLQAIHLEAGSGRLQITNPEGVVTEIQLTNSSTLTHQALIGFDAFALPGRYLVELSGDGLSRPWRPFRQQITVGDPNYGLQQITLTGQLAELLTPELRFAENAFLAEIFIESQLDPLWDGTFIQPVTNTTVTARYGDFRSYNEAPVINFHSGIDFAGGIGTPILAPAAGTVVFSDTLELRGNGLIIDHGMGVMTAYYHLSEIDVEVGELVVPGQPIAKGGSTGLSTGPHLHWDVRVWGAAVEPTQWLEQSFP